MKLLRSLSLVLLVLAGWVLAQPARAAGADMLTITDCSNDTPLSLGIAKMQANENGGTVTFDCGKAAITLTSQLPEISTGTVIDGGGKITLDGADAVRLFAVKDGGKLTLKNLVAQHGLAENGNGGAILNAGELLLDHVTIQFSESFLNGGAIASTGPVRILNSTLQSNHARIGGALYVEDDHVHVVSAKIGSSTFANNIASVSQTGGAIDSGATLNIKASHFMQNKAGNGGAIHLHSASEITNILDSDFSMNQATGSAPNALGGALLVEGTHAQIVHSRFTENEGQSGGAIYVMPASHIGLSASTLEFNGAGSGAGIFNAGDVGIADSTLVQNHGLQGGGIHNSGALSMFNSTLSANDAAVGGGLSNRGGSATLLHVTLEKNMTSDPHGGGGIFSDATGSPRLALTNVIVADSPAGGNCAIAASLAAGGHNLSSDNTCAFGGNGDNVNVKLGPLADNGGLTQTHLLLPGSPAIDAALTVDLHIDQRGVERPQGKAFDVGAVEATISEGCPGKPAQPVLRAPANNRTVKTNRPTLKWNPAACASSYTVIIKDSATGKRVDRKSGLTGLEYKTVPLTGGKKYKWFVQACNLPKGCKKSSVQRFMVR